MAQTDAVPVERLLRPKSIAVIGVSPTPGSTGASVLGSLANFDYKGAIHIVSRGRTEVLGRPCVATVDELPEGIDCAVICLPQVAVVEAVAACARRKIGAAVIYASGFAEQDEKGEADQAEINRIARAHGMAILGPNCLGFTNYVKDVPLGFSLQQRPAPAKQRVLAIVAQSGGMGASLRGALLQHGIDATYVVSTGNEAAATVEDFLADIVEDPSTKVIASIVEHLRKPQLFLEIARRARELGKPIVLLHPGRSAKARDAARSHTGALAGDHAIMRALVRHEAVVLVDSYNEWIDVTALLCRYPAPPAGGVGVITNSGAFRGITFDLCETLGLDVPEFTPATKEALRQVIPSFAAPSNPLDLTAQTIGQKELVGLSAKPVIEDPTVGSVVLALVGNGPSAIENARHAIPALQQAKKPVIYSLISEITVLGPELPDALRAADILFFRSPENALAATARATEYGKSLRAAEQRVPASGAPAATLPRGGVLTEYEGKQYLAAAGIPVPQGGLAKDLDSAKAIAKKIGYPVVLKAQARELTHKSDAGGVILSLADEGALARGWQELQDNLRRSRPDLALDGVLVEAMGKRGIEMVVGARRDSDWGPVLLVGLGGIWIETLNDVRLMPPDLTETAIVEEILRLRGAKLLQGARGAKPADIGALAKAVARVGALVRATPSLNEIDINPLVVYPEGEGVLALDALIVADEAAR
jgi:acyl-CoA synthetase (NDP forming)